MRKWLAECHAWLDDPTSVQYKDDTGIWKPVSTLVNPISSTHMTWRIKPKTLSINGREFEYPVARDLNVSNQHYLEIFAETGRYVTRAYFWHNTKEARDLHYKILVEESSK